MFKKLMGRLLKRPFSFETATAPESTPRRREIFEYESAQSADSKEKNLLESSRTQWQLGDWANLTKLQLKTLQDHPARDELALLAAVGQLQTGNIEEGRQLTGMARDWGCSKKLMSQLLISGVYNSLGRIAACSGQAQHAIQLFESAMEIAVINSELRPLTERRIYSQLSQLGLPANILKPHK